jgi:hypothetical protein
MTNTRSWTAPVWTRVLGLLIAPLLFHCGGEPTDDPSAPGASGAASAAAAIDPAQDPNNPANQLFESGCTHMQWCHEPGTGLAVCITNDNVRCTAQQRLSECFSDARNICGTSNFVERPRIPRCPDDRCRAGCAC